jgi:hypothetical protein
MDFAAKNNTENDKHIMPNSQVFPMEFAAKNGTENDIFFKHETYSMAINALQDRIVKSDSFKLNEKNKLIYELINKHQLNGYYCRAFYLCVLLHRVVR